MPPFMWRYLNRLNQILSFAKAGSSLIDVFKLVILGFARGHPFNSPGLISTIGRYIWPTLSVKLRTISDYQIELDPSDLGHLISFEEIFIGQCYKLGLIPFGPEKIFDCGAHIGFFSLLAAQAYPETEIIAFEPNPENANFIRRQLKNKSHKINLVEAAVSIREGEGQFKADYSNSGSLQAGLLVSPKCYTVTIIDFPKLISEIKPTSILLKVDIEGEEKSLLPALIPHLPHKCAIFFESHDGEQGWQSLHQALSSVGFQVQQMRCQYPYVDGFALRA